MSNPVDDEQDEGFTDDDVVDEVVPEKVIVPAKVDVDVERKIEKISSRYIDINSIIQSLLRKEIELDDEISLSVIVETTKQCENCERFLLDLREKKEKLFHGLEIPYDLSLLERDPRMFVESYHRTRSKNIGLEYMDVDSIIDFISTSYITNYKLVSRLKLALIVIDFLSDKYLEKHVLNDRNVSVNSEAEEI